MPDTTDITPDWPDYDGPRIDLMWADTTGVAQAYDASSNSPSVLSTWVLVPVDLLNRLCRPWVADLDDLNALRTLLTDAGLYDTPADEPSPWAAPTT